MTAPNFSTSTVDVLTHNADGSKTLFGTDSEGCPWVWVAPRESVVPIVKGGELL